MKRKKYKDKLISLKQAAQISGYAPDYLGYLIRRKKISGQIIYDNPKWLIAENDLLRYLAEKRKIKKQKFFYWKTQYISLKQAAQISGYAPDYIGYLVRNKRIRGYQVYSGLKWLISQKSIENYLEIRRRRKYPFGFISFYLESFFEKIIVLFLQTTKYGTISFILALIFFGGLIAWAIVPKSPVQTVEVYPALVEGAWQNSENVLGLPQAGPQAGINYFSENNSAVYEKDTRNLLISKFYLTALDLELKEKEIKQEEKFAPPLEEERKIKEDIVNSQAEDIETEAKQEETEKETEDKTEEEIEHKADNLSGKEELSEEEEDYRQEEHKPEEEKENEKLLDSSLKETIAEEPLKEEELKENSAESSTEEEAEILNKDDKEEFSFFQKAKYFFQNNFAVAGQIPAFAELKEKEFLSARIKFSFALGKKEIDLFIDEGEEEDFENSTGFWHKTKNLAQSIWQKTKNVLTKVQIVFAKEDEDSGFNENSHKDKFITEEKHQTEKKDIVEDENYLTTENNEETLIVPDADTKIIISYSLDNNEWHILDSIIGLDFSNALNNGYFTYQAPFINSWQDIENLQIKFEGVLGGQSQIIAYLDSLWLEIDYQEKEDELIVDALKENWRADEIPEFVIRPKSEKQGLANTFSSLFEKKPEVKQVFLQTSYGSSLYLEKGRDVLMEEDSGLYLKLISPIGLKPGKHTLKAEVVWKGKTHVLEQDFTWGVLAINLNKSIYTLEDELAYIQMAVLDDKGDTICNADLELIIKAQHREKTDYLSSAEGTIEYSLSCGANNVTDIPDYFAYYALPQEPGSYKITLTAHTYNGTRTITDSFEIRDSVPFDIERIGPTRIYPPADYEVKMIVRANRDFKGEIIEKVPGSFEITSHGLRQIRTQNNTKEIVWQVVWEEGETYELSYTFKAPNISPEFYLLGPLEIYQPKSLSGQGINPLQSALFSEQRQWQIAADETEERVPTSCSGDYTNCSNAYSDNNNYAYLNEEGSATWSGYGFDVGSESTIEEVTIRVRHCIENSAGKTLSIDVYDGSNWSDTETLPADASCASQTTRDFDFTDYIDTPAKLNSIQVRVNYEAAGGPPSSREHRVYYIPVIASYTEPVTIISGTIYTDEGTATSTQGSLIKLAVDGDLVATTTASSTNGGYIFEIDPDIVSTSTPITVFIDDSSESGAAITLYGGEGDLENFDIYINRLIVRHEDQGPITNQDIGHYTVNTPYSITAGPYYELTADDNHKLLVWPGMTYKPGGDIIVPALSISGTFEPESNVVSLIGYGENSDCSEEADTVMPFCIESEGSFISGNSTISFESTIATTTIASTTYYNIQANPATGSPAFVFQSGIITVSNNFTATTTDNAEAVINANINQPEIRVSNNFLIGQNQSFEASGSSELKISGNFNNQGAFYHNSGTIRFENSSKNSAIYGATTFYDFISTASSKTLSFEDGQQSTTTIEGRLTLEPDPQDCETPIYLRSVNQGNEWYIDVDNPGSTTLNYLNIKDSYALAALTAENSVGAGNNTNWNIEGGNCAVGITISGRIYTDEGNSTTTATSTVYLAIDGELITSTEVLNGEYEFVEAEVSAGYPITVFLDGATESGAAVTLASVGNINDLDIYINRVIARHHNLGPITNQNIGHYTTSTMPFSISGSNLTVADDHKLLIWPNNTYKPGGSLTAPALSVQGAFQPESNTVLLTDSGQSADCQEETGIVMPLCIGIEGSFNANNSTVIFQGINNTNLPGIEYHKLEIDPQSGNPNYNFLNSATTTDDFIINSGTVTASTSLAIAGNFNNQANFIHNNGLVILNGASQQTVSGNLTFYDLTIKNTYGSVTGCNTSFTPGIIFATSTEAVNNYTIETAGLSAGVYIQYNNDSTYTFENIIWTGTTAKQIYFRNSDLNSGYWYLNVAGSQSVSYLNTARSDASGGAEIEADNGTNTDCGNNINWLFTISISGTVFQSDRITTSTAGSIVHLAINGSSTATTTVSSLNGNYIFSNISESLLSSSTPLTVFIEDGTESGASILLYGQSGNLSGLDIYDKHISLGHESSGPITNQHIGHYDSGDNGNIPYSVEAGPLYSLTAEDNHTLIVSGSYTYEPTWDIDVAYLTVESGATFSGLSSFVLIRGGGTPFNIDETSFLNANTSTFRYTGQSATSSLILRPSANGTTNQWSVSGAGQNWQAVSEELHDSDNTYIYTSTNENIDLFNLPDEQIPKGSIIGSVTVYAAARKTANPAVNISLSVRTNNSNYFSGDHALTQSYSLYSTTWTTNPSTGLPWTVEEIDALEAGVRANTSRETRVTQIYVEIGYTPPLYIAGAEYHNLELYPSSETNYVLGTAEDQTIKTSGYAEIGLAGNEGRIIGSVYNPDIEAEGNFSISSNNIFDFPDQTASIILRGNFENQGAFSHSSSTITLNGTAQQIISGNLTGSSAFYDLTIENTYGSVTGCNTSFTPGIIFATSTEAVNNYTIETAGLSAGVYIQYNNDSTYTFENIIWTGTTAKQIYFRNSDLNSGYWYLNVAGSQSVSYLNTARSDASGGAEIEADNGTNTDCGNNINWLFAVSVNISGTVFEQNRTGTSTAGSIVHLAINGSSIATTTASSTSGEYIFENIDNNLLSIGTPLTVFIEDGTESGASILLYSGLGHIVGLDIYDKHISLKHENSGPITNQHISHYDSGDNGSIPYSVDEGPLYNLEVDDNHTLLVSGSFTYEPTWNIDTPKFTADNKATFNGLSSFIALRDDNLPFDIDVYQEASFNAGTSTISFEGTAGTTTIPVFTYYNLQTNPASGTPNYILESIVGYGEKELLTGLNKSQWGSGSSLPDDPYNTSYDDSRSQSIYLASELTAAGVVSGPITAIALEAAEEHGQPNLKNFRIRMKQTNATATTEWEGGWVTVFGPEDIEVEVDQWYNFEFDIPFYWDGTSNLMVDISRNDIDSTSGGGMYRRLDAGSNRTFSGYCDDCDLYQIDSGSTAGTAKPYVPVIRLFGGDMGITVDNNFTATTTNNALSLIDANTYDPQIIIGNNFVLHNNQTFEASGISEIKIGGNFIGRGAFNHNFGTIRFENSDKTSTIYGANTFYNFISTTTSKILAFEPGQSSTTTILGVLILEPDPQNCETPIYLRSSSDGSRWYIDAQATTTLNYLNIKDSYALTSLIAQNSVSEGNNTNWTIYGGECAVGITISGNVYTDEGVSTTTATSTVYLAIDGDLIGSTEVFEGEYTFTGVEVSAGFPITVFLDGAAESGATITLYNEDNINDLDIYKNRLIVRHHDSGPINNQDIGHYATGTPFSVSLGPVYELTVEQNHKLLIRSASTFQPEGNVITPALSIEGTFEIQTNSLFLTSSGESLDCQEEAGVVMPLCIISEATFTSGTSLVSFEATAATTSIASTTYYNLQTNPATGSPAFIFQAGTISINNDFTASTTDNAQALINANANDPEITIANDFILSPGQTFEASGSANLKLAGNWNNSGNFIHQNGTVEFINSSKESTLSGATVFYNFFSEASSKTLNFPSGLSGTTTIEGIFTLDGQDCLTTIKLRSDNSPEQWYVSAASSSLNYIDVKDSYAVFALTADNSYDSGNNDNWNIVIGECLPPIEISGSVFIDEGLTITSDNSTVYLAINGNLIDNAKVSDGNYSFIFTPEDPNIPTTTDPVTVFLGNDPESGAAITVYNSDSITDLDIYLNRVIVRHHYGTFITNEQIGHYATSTPFLVSAGPLYELTVEQNHKLLIRSGSTFQPEGNVITPALSIKGTFQPQTNTLALIAGGENNDCSEDAGEMMPLCRDSGGNFVTGSSVVSFEGAATTSIATLFYYNLQTNASSSGLTYYFNSGSVIVSNNLSLLDNGGQVTLRADLNDPSITLGNNLAIEANQDFIVSGTNSLNIGGSFDNQGIFTHGESTIIFNANSSGQTINAGQSAFYNIEFDGTGSWEFVATTTVENNLTIIQGAVTAPSSVLEIAGNFDNEDTFIHNQGQVIFIDNNKESQILGVITFYDFISNTSGKILKFEAGENTTTTVINHFNLSLESNSENCSVPIEIVSNLFEQRWYLDVQGTSTLSFVYVQDSYAINPLSAVNSFDGGNNVSWTIESGPLCVSAIDISGYVYQADMIATSTAGSVIHLAVSRNFVASTTASVINGSYQFSEVEIGTFPGVPVTVFIEDIGESGATVYRYEGFGNIEELNLYDSYVVLRHEDSGPITNENIGHYTSGAPFSLSGENKIIIEAGHKLLIWQDNIYRPVGELETPALTIRGTFKPESNTFTLTASGKNTDCQEGIGIVMPLCLSTEASFESASSTAVFKGEATTTVAGLSYYNLLIDPSAGNPDYDFSDSALTINNFTINSGRVLAPSVLNIGGNWSNYGTFLHNEGEIIFTAADSRTIDPGQDAFWDITFDGGEDASWEFATSTVLEGNFRSIQGLVYGNKDIVIKGGSLDCGVTSCGNIYFDGGTLSLQGTGTLGTSNLTVDYWMFYNFVLGDGETSAETVSYLDSGSYLLVANNFTIQENHTFTAPQNNVDFNIEGNYINNGILSHNEGEIIFSGSETQTLSGNLNSESSFYILTFKNSSGSNEPFQPGVILSASTSAYLSNIDIASARVQFQAESYFYFENINWQGRADNLIFLRSSATGTQWLLEVENPTPVSYINVQDSDASSTYPYIDATDETSFDAGNNINWVFETISISGQVFSDEYGSVSSKGAVIRLVISTDYYNSTTTASTSNGFYQFTNVPKEMATGLAMTVLVEDEEDSGATITRHHGEEINIENLDIYLNRIIVRHHDTGPITNEDIGHYRQNTPYSVGPGPLFTLQVNENHKILVWSESTYQPRGNVETPAITVQGVFEPENYIISLTASGISTTCQEGAGTVMPLCLAGQADFIVASSTISFEGPATTSIPVFSYYNLQFNSSGQGYYIFLESIATTTNSFSIYSGTVSGPDLLTVGGNWLNQAFFNHNKGAVILTSSSSSSLSPGGENGSFWNLTLDNNAGEWTLEDDMVIDNIFDINAGTFNAGQSLISLKGSGTPLIISGIFQSATSTVSFEGTSSTTTIANIVYYNLQTNPATGTPTFILDSGQLSINNNFIATTSNIASAVIDIQANNIITAVNNDFIIGSGQTFLSSNSLTIGSNFQNNGTFVHNNGTIFFNATASGKSIYAGESSFYDLVFDGQNGGWSFTASTTLEGNLRSVQGLLSSAYDLTVKGGHIDCGLTCGEISFSSGNVVLENTGNFGTSGLTADWQFYDLSLGDGLALATTTSYFAVGSDLKVFNDLTVLASHSFIGPQDGADFIVSGSWHNAGSFFHNSGTIVFDATTTDKTIISNGSSFYNLIFDGSGGLWTFEDEAEVDNNLLILDGLASSTHNMSVYGGEVTGSGVLNWSSGTFLLSGTGNFGGSNSWNFYNLTFGGASSGTTTANSIGTTTVFNVLTVGENQTLMAGEGRWILEKSGLAGEKPFIIFGNFNAQSSTFEYQAGASTDVTLTSYYDLNINGPGPFTTESGNLFINNSLSCLGGIFTLNGTTTVNNNVLVDSGAELALNEKDLTVNNGDIATNGTGTITCSDCTSGKVELLGQGIIGGGTGSITFYNLVLSGSVAVTDLASNITLLNDIEINSNRTLDASEDNYQIMLGGSWANSGNFVRREGTVIFNATTAGKTISDNGWPFWNIVFDGIGGQWLYKDSLTSTAPNSTVVENGQAIFLNAKTGPTTVNGGNLNVDWYLGIHIIDKEYISKNIEQAEVTLYEASGSSTVWLMSEGDWGIASSSQQTLTDSQGQTPQPDANGALRIREYSQNSATASYYIYNVSIEAAGFSPYDYYLDYGNNYLISSSSPETENVDKVISPDWHRIDNSQINSPYSCQLNGETGENEECINQPPTNGSWYLGLNSDFRFALDSSSVEIGYLNELNVWTATGTTILSATTSYPDGYHVNTYAGYEGQLQYWENEEVIDYIDRWPHNNSQPAEWSGLCQAGLDEEQSDEWCGFGYTTSDVALGPDCNDNRFASSTKYAGFAVSSLEAGEVARSCAAVPEGENTTIIYRVSAPQMKAPGIYSATVYYIGSVNY